MGRQPESLTHHVAHRVLPFFTVMLARACRSWQLEASRVELLVDHDHPSAVPGQHLHRVASLAHEDE